MRKGCGDIRGCWVCTLPLGHEGDHVATDAVENDPCALMGTKTFDRWPVATATPAAPIEKRHGTVAGETADQVRIRQLEKQLVDDAAAWRDGLNVASARATRNADAAGALRTERDELLRENAILRRKLERATGSPTGSKDR